MNTNSSGQMKRETNAPIQIRVPDSGEEIVIEEIDGEYFLPEAAPESSTRNVVVHDGVRSDRPTQFGFEF